MARTCRSPDAEIVRRAHAPSLVPFGVAALIATPTPARAMHLAEGTLPAAWSAGWWALAAAALAFALTRLRTSTRRDAIARPLTGTMAALIFVLSSVPIPVPIAGSSGHACGTGLAAVMVGPWLTLLAGFVSLLLQALVEGHGGITTLGANAVSMGLAGAVAGWGTFRLARRMGMSLPAAGGLAGVAADVATYATTTLQLALAHHGEHSLTTAAAGLGTAFLPIQLPIALLEGAIAAGALKLLQGRSPALLVRLGVLRAAPEAT